MDAVGDVTHDLAVPPIVGPQMSPQVAGDTSVQLADTVDVVSRSNREGGQVEPALLVVAVRVAEREKIAPSYMTRVLRLTLLSPEIVEAILDGIQGPEVTLARLLEPFTQEWAKQSEHFIRSR